MGRVWKLSRCVAGGLLCVAAVAHGYEAAVAPAPRVVPAHVAPMPAAVPMPTAPMPTAVPAPTAPAAQVTAPGTIAPTAGAELPPLPTASGTALPLPMPTTTGQPPLDLPPLPGAPGSDLLAIPQIPAPGAPATPSTTQPKKPEAPKAAPRDTTRQPIDRLLEPGRPARPGGKMDAAATPAEYAHFPTLGFAGRSGVLPRSGSNDEYETMEDRWRIGFPAWDRYDKGHPRVFDYPYQPGAWYDPFRQNVLKGDYPVIGQHTFFQFTGTNSSLFDARMVPTATTPFESTARPLETEFFQRPGQFLFSNLTTASFELFHGDAAFKPKDWAVHVTPAFNYNALSVSEVGVISPDVRKGTVRLRSWATLQEWFAEYKLADLSEQYDFVSLRAGSQPFTSDFRGFIFSDVNRGVRLFGNLDGNRTQFNLAYFRQLEKETNSGLNTFTDRDQDIVIANLYRQDFLFPGYTASVSYHYNNDAPSFKFDKNGFLVRPDPAGVFTPHRVEAHYLGWAGDGHIDRYNISHAFYWVLGRDSRNPIAGQATNISAQMAALELSYDRDYVRFRTSGLYQSGDGNARDGHATGFDGILDQQNFGGEFSFWRRNRVPLFGVGLTNDQSNYANLRSSRIQGQSNFVNPGLWLINAGMDIDITPRLRSINNANALFFNKTSSLEVFTFQSNIDNYIGTDLSTGFEWRPRLNNNGIVLAGLSTLIPGGGFRQLYNDKGGKVQTLFNGFAEVVFTF